MAQVTMSGNEFATMLRQERERDELLTTFISAQQIKFTEDNCRTYSVGETPKFELPKWVRNVLIEDMVMQLQAKDDKELALWFGSKFWYYKVFPGEFSQYDLGGAIDLVEYSPALKARYEAWENKPETPDDAEEEKED